MNCGNSSRELRRKKAPKGVMRASPFVAWRTTGPLSWVVMEQAPVLELQQAPSTGCGQGFGRQVVSGPCHVLGDWQLASVVTVHAPVAGLQQAPVGGCGRGFGKQLVFGPCQMFGAWQLDSVVTVQVPVVGLQQAPPAGHGSGTQGTLTRQSPVEQLS